MSPSPVIYLPAQRPSVHIAYITSLESVKTLNRSHTHSRRNYYGRLSIERLLEDRLDSGIELL